MGIVIFYVMPQTRRCRHNPEDPTNWDGAAAFYGDHIQQMINDGCPE
ncbi:hypothetical protein [Photobacterium kishitanii]|nr:hypothetical protein [Photobacterium kishitanii]